MFQKQYYLFLTIFIKKLLYIFEGDYPISLP